MRSTSNRFDASGNDLPPPPPPPPTGSFFSRGSGGDATRPSRNPGGGDGGSSAGSGGDAPRDRERTDGPDGPRKEIGRSLGRKEERGRTGVGWKPFNQATFHHHKMENHHNKPMDGGVASRHTQPKRDTGEPPGDTKVSRKKERRTHIRKYGTPKVPQGRDPPAEAAPTWLGQPGTSSES